MTVPKRRITTAERALQTTRTIIDRLTTDYPLWLTAVADTAPSPLRAANHNQTRGADRADPTANTALLTVDQRIIDIDEALLGLLTQARWIADQLRPLLATATPRAREDDAARRAALCADPLCAEYAVARGLCKPHYDAQRYAQRQAATASAGAESYPSSPRLPAAPYEAARPGSDGMSTLSTLGMLETTRLGPTGPRNVSGTITCPACHADLGPLAAATDTELHAALGQLLDRHRTTEH